MNDAVESLRTKGYCIVPNVLTEDEVETCVESFHKWRNSIDDIDYVETNINGNGIHKFYNAGHTWHAWYIRTRPSVQAIFKTLWNCDELITSFDGCCYIPKTCENEDMCWTHSDQAPCYDGLQCFQSYVSLTENKERTFVVYEGSHLLHKSYFEELNMEHDTRNWQIINPDYLAKIYDSRRVLHVPRGSMVIWDSRVFHQNQFGAPNSEERMIQYICFLPKNHDENVMIQQEFRKHCLEQLRTTTHWPAPIQVVALQPNQYRHIDFNIDYSTFENACLDEFIEDIEKII